MKKPWVKGGMSKYPYAKGIFLHIQGVNAVSRKLLTEGNLFLLPYGQRKNRKMPLGQGKFIYGV